MAENPLFYKNVVPLNREIHRGLRFQLSADRFAFAAGSYLIPAVVDEFSVGGRHLPIVFVPGAKHPSAVFLLGLKPGENRFVTPNGTWGGDYVPAFVRRYPFIIGEVSGSDPIVCIDEDYDGFKTQAGEPLFTDSGEDTPVLRGNIQFINNFMAAAKRTEAFLAKVTLLGLLRAITIDVRGEAPQTLHGLQTIDVAKLDALNDADFGSLRQDGYLPLIYAHLQSLAGIDKLLPIPTAADRLDAPEPVEDDGDRVKQHGSRLN